MNQILVNKFNSIAVNVYKGLGSALLTLILGGLVSYLGVQIFFFVSHSWAAPTVVSPTDPEILQLNAQLAQQTAARDRLLSERRELTARLEQAARLLAAEKDFQARFLLAMGGERKAREQSLHRLIALRREYQLAAQEISKSNKAYANMARVRTETLYNARMMEREEQLTSNHQLAQMAQSNLSLAEGSVEMTAKVEVLQRELDGLDATLGGKPEGLTTQVLMLEREYTRSLLEVSRVESEHAYLQESLHAMDEAVKRYDRLLSSISGSPWLESIQRGQTVGFVPYENLDNARPGTPLYRCAMKLVWCRQVGKVGRALQGEVSVKHPVRQAMLRGVMVELRLEEDRWAREEVLHLGRSPLLL